MNTHNQHQIIIIYAGRFQPFHPGHHEVYKQMVKMYGPANVFLTTSNLVDDDQSPWDFEQKAYLMNKIFEIPREQIVWEPQPYQPTNIFSMFDGHQTSVIFVVGEKNNDRLTSKYFQPFESQPLKCLNQTQYVMYIESKLSGLSASFIRRYFEYEPCDHKLKKFFVDVYQKFDQEIFDQMKSYFQK